MILFSNSGSSSCHGSSMVGQITSSSGELQKDLLKKAKFEVDLEG